MFYMEFKGTSFSLQTQISLPMCVSHIHIAYINMHNLPSYVKTSQVSAQHTFKKQNSVGRGEDQLF